MICKLLALAILLFMAGTASAAPLDVRINAPSGTLVHGQKTTDMTNGGETLAASTAVLSVSLKAACSNLVSVHVGASTVNASTSLGRTLAPCETLDLDVKNLNVIYVDSGTTTTAVIEYVGVVGP